MRDRERERKGERKADEGKKAIRLYCLVRGKRLTASLKKKKRLIITLDVT